MKDISMSGNFSIDVRTSFESFDVAGRLMDLARPDGAGEVE